MSKIYVNARCKALENKLLSTKKLNQMIDSKSPIQALKILTDNKIGYTITTDPYQFEIILEEEKQKFFEFIKSLPLDDEIKDYFLIPQDYYNAEIIVKSEITGDKTILDLLKTSGKIEIKKLIDCIQNNDLSLLPKHLSKLLERKDLKILSGKNLSTTFKKSLYEDILSISNNKLLQEIINTKIDLINIESCFRVDSKEDFKTIAKINGGKLNDEVFDIICDRDTSKISKIKHCYLYEDIKPLLENKETKSLSKIEKKIDDIPLIKLNNNEYKYKIEGVYPTLKYLFLVQSMIKNIRIVMVGLINNLSSEEIRDRLRWNYEG